MVTIRSGFVIALGLLVALTAGCASDQPEEGTGTEMAEPMAQEPAMEPQPAEPEPMPMVVEPARPETRGSTLYVPVADQSPDLREVDSLFYFDFDKAIVKRAGHAALGEHAAYLAANPSAAVRLEGHADERGTREYNLALGERRANAVGAYLRAQGASASQIEAISYGEEKPAAMGHDEASWARNRRVELIYKE